MVHGGDQSIELEPAEFDIRLRDHDGVTVVSVTGELDLMTAPRLRDAIGGLGHSRTLVIDLAALRFVDSSGLAVFVNVNREARRDGRTLAFVRAPETVQRIFAVTGLEPVLPFTADLPDALAAVRA